MDEGLLKREVSVDDRALVWEFTVIDKPDVNAFVLPGGKVFVYTGMLEFCRTDAELGVILAHELAHVQLRHTASSASA